MRTNARAYALACLGLLAILVAVPAQANPFAGYRAASEPDPDQMCTGGIDTSRWPPAPGDATGSAAKKASSFPAADYNPYGDSQKHAGPQQVNPAAPQWQPPQSPQYGGDYGYAPGYGSGYGSGYDPGQGYYGQQGQGSYGQGSYGNNPYQGPYSPAPQTPWNGSMPFPSITTPFPAFW